MPHILLEKHNDIKLDNGKNLKATFNFIAKSKYDQKIGAVIEDKEVLLTKVEKNGNDLIKLDNPTRLTPVSLMKEVLNDYASIANSKLLFTNTHSIYNRMETEKTYLKNISYFENEFKTNKEIWVEVGFGSGVHLLHQAKQNPDKLVIGLEIHTPSIEQVLKQVKLDNIENVLILNYDARLFLEFLDSNSVGRIFVHFPVPWDKKPHRRVMSVEFIEESLRVLKIDGTLELRTDSPNYFEYSSGLLDHFKDYPSTIEKNKDLAVTSKYEARWKRQAKDIWDVTIVSNKNSSEVILDGDFSFSHIEDMDRLKERIKATETIKDKFLVHFENIYEIDTVENKGLLVKVTFGSFNRPVTKYIIIQNNEARYFQGDPIKTKVNLISHKMILETIR
ncbi:MAG: tRNA (guanosine(46)-N7)-methyltransferase TrmB [Campylobacterota bacterium]|nr:tRNA (guanosine(46)-N7)-methyltransferase TrmB [Campylobacterota bacterium]